MFNEREKTIKSLTQISNKANFSQLTESFPEQFTPAILDSFSGAAMKGSEKNTKFVLLEQYHNSVVHDEVVKEASVKFEVLQNHEVVQVFWFN